MGKASRLKAAKRAAAVPLPGIRIRPAVAGDLEVINELLATAHTKLTGYVAEALTDPQRSTGFGWAIRDRQAFARVLLTELRGD